MRALVVHSGADLYGSDRILWESVAGLVEDGIEVIVVLPHPGPIAERLREAGAAVSYAPTLILRRSLMKLSRIPELVWGTLQGLYCGWRTIVRVRPDVVFINTVAIPLWPALAWVRRIPSISHVHEAELNTPSWANRLIYLAHHPSRTLVVNSEFTKDVISHVYPRLADRAHVIYNGVLGPTTITRLPAERSGPLRLLFVGRLSERKGVDLVIEATALLLKKGIEVQSTLLGATFEGNSDFDVKLRERAVELEVTDCIVFAGFHESVWPFLDDCDVLVVPSRFDESFGNVVVEGALAARPTIVSDSSGLREAAFGMCASTLVSPDCAVAIADAIVDLLEDWQQVPARALHDRSRALEQFSPARYRQDIARMTRNTFSGELH